MPSYQELVVHCERLIQQRLGNWPKQWEGFHWPGYTCEHTFRVRNLALSLARQEGADLEVVELAALLHDICKPSGQDHAHTGAAEAARVLRLANVSREQIERIHSAIATHAGDNTPTHPIENRVLGDADLIDANFGLVATWRFITIRAGRESSVAETVEAMADWLPRKDELLGLTRSAAGLAVAQERSAAMHTFCREIVADYALPEGAGKGLREMVELIAAGYERASLAEQLPQLAAGPTPVAQAAARRLAAEMAGEM